MVRTLSYEDTYATKHFVVYRRRGRKYADANLNNMCGILCFVFCAIMNMTFRHSIFIIVISSVLLITSFVLCTALSQTGTLVMIGRRHAIIVGQGKIKDLTTNTSSISINCYGYIRIRNGSEFIEISEVSKNHSKKMLTLILKSDALRLLLDKSSYNMLS
jgi:hypothetical protein